MPSKLQARKGKTLQPEAIRFIRKTLGRWGVAHYRDLPWRRPSAAWHGLIAEVLLQRTRAENVVPVYNNILGVYPTLQSLASAPLSSIESLIYPLGLRWRVPLFKQLVERLHEMNGNVPATLDELKALPAVGDYAAAAWLGFHGNKRAVIIDANVVRLICRLVGQPMDGETRRKRWLIALADHMTPARGWKRYNYAVLDFTVQICKRKPECNKCPLRQVCVYGYSVTARHEQSSSFRPLRKPQRNQS